MITKTPYPQKNIANGIAFSNNLDNKNTSSSLNVILKASNSNDQTLLSWCKQGVLMINTALSVEEGKPSSHSLLWKPFMTSFIKNLSEWETGMIYLLFGNTAQSFEPFINKDLNYVLKEKHPSYYARLNQDMHSTIFIETNKLLKLKYNQTIKW